jgi:hypothetical protein
VQWTRLNCYVSAEASTSHFPVGKKRGALLRFAVTGVQTISPAY